MLSLLLLLLIVSEQHWEGGGGRGRRMGPLVVLALLVASAALGTRGEQLLFSTLSPSCDHADVCRMPAGGQLWSVPLTLGHCVNLDDQWRLPSTLYRSLSLSGIEGWPGVYFPVLFRLSNCDEGALVPRAWPACWSGRWCSLPEPLLLNGTLFNSYSVNAAPAWCVNASRTVAESCVAPVENPLDVTLCAGDFDHQQSAPGAVVHSCSTALSVVTNATLNAVHALPAPLWSAVTNETYSFLRLSATPTGSVAMHLLPSAAAATVIEVTPYTWSRLTAPLTALNATVVVTALGLNLGTDVCTEFGTPPEDCFVDDFTAKPFPPVRPLPVLEGFWSPAHIALVALGVVAGITLVVVIVLLAARRARRRPQYRPLPDIAVLGE